MRRMAPHQWLCDLPDLSLLTLNYQLEARDLTVCTGCSILISRCSASLLRGRTSTAAAGHRITLLLYLSTGVCICSETSAEGWVATDFDAPWTVRCTGLPGRTFMVEGKSYELLLIGTPPRLAAELHQRH